MENAEALEAPEVPDIEGEQLLDAMDVHACRQPGIMDLHALNMVRDKQGPPAVMNFPAIRQKLEIAFDHAGQPVRLGDA